MMTDEEFLKFMQDKGWVRKLGKYSYKYPPAFMPD
jgi:hypothetical protein